MEALESSEGVDSYPGSRDKPGTGWGIRRGETLVRLEIECRMPNQQVGSHLLQKGKNVITCRRKEAAGVFEGAEHWKNGEAERIKVAAEQYEKEVISELNEAHRPDLSLPAFREHLEDVLTKPRATLSPEETALLEERDVMYQTTASSVEKCFFREHYRGISPFVSVKVLDEKVPAPTQSDDLNHMEALVKAAVIAAQGGSVSPDAFTDELRKLTKMVEDQAAEIARLKTGKK